MSTTVGEPPRPAISKLNSTFSMLKTQLPQAIRSHDGPKPASGSLRHGFFGHKFSTSIRYSSSRPSSNSSPTASSQTSTPAVTQSRPIRKSASTPTIRHVTEEPRETMLEPVLEDHSAKTVQPPSTLKASNEKRDWAPPVEAKAPLRQPPSDSQLFKTSIFSAKDSAYDLYSLPEVSPMDESLSSAGVATEPTTSPTTETQSINTTYTSTVMIDGALRRKSSISFAPEPFPRRSSIPKSETWGSLTSRQSSISFAADLGLHRRDSSANSETGSSFGTSSNGSGRRGSAPAFMPEILQRRDSSTSDADSTHLSRKWSISSFRRSRNQSSSLPQVDERFQRTESELGLSGVQGRVSSPPPTR